jgi:uncharacterized protein YlaN (UPF0358 family)
MGLMLSDKALEDRKNGIRWSSTWSSEDKTCVLDTYAYNEKVLMTKFHGMIKEVDLLRARIAELEDGACHEKVLMTKFHGMIKEVDLLRARIAELEDGACRFNCRKEKDAFMAGWNCGVEADGGDRFDSHWMPHYNEWIKERE